MIYKIDKIALLQEDMYPQQPSGMSSIAKKGAALLGVGAAGALAHAGTFGTGTKNFVDGVGSAAHSMAQTAGHKMGEALNGASTFYGHPASSAPSTPDGTYKHDVEQKTHDDANHVAGDHNTEDDGSFVHGALAGAAGLAGLVGLGKGAKAFGKSDAYRNYKMGAAGHQGTANNHGIFRSAGLAQHRFGNKLSGAYKGFKNG